MLTLWTFGPMFGQPDPSPFCMKAMALLEISGLEYTTRRGDPRKAPKGKLPWLEDNGTVVPDSTFIQRHLETRHGIDFYPGLDAASKATAWAFEKMCEEHLYFCVLHDRWMIDANFNKGPRKFFDVVPALLRPLITAKVRRDIRRTLNGQGIGRHSTDEIVALATREIDAIADFLGSKPYVMGDTVTGTDATVHAFLIAGMTPLFDGPIRQAILRGDNLRSYVERLNDAWYPGQIEPHP